MNHRFKNSQHSSKNSYQNIMLLSSEYYKLEQLRINIYGYTNE